MLFRSEILSDLGCLYYVPFRKDGTEPYVNQFKMGCGFKYKTDQVKEYLYPYIANEYSELKFIYVHDKSDSTVEKEYAEKNSAIFWRNGLPYKKDFNDKELDEASVEFSDKSVGRRKRHNGKTDNVGKIEWT